MYLVALKALKALLCFLATPIHFYTPLLEQLFVAFLYIGMLLLVDIDERMHYSDMVSDREHPL